MAGFSALLMVLGVATSHAGMEKGWIHVYDSAQLQAAMQPANAGRNVLVHEGEYTVSQTLVVPEGATVRGAGRMLYDQDGYPDGFAADSGTRLKASMDLVGDVVMLGNGSRIENILIRDISWAGPINGVQQGDCTVAELSCQGAPERKRCCTVNRGNLVLIGARAQNDVVSATINECEFVTPNFSGIAPSGPTGRSVAVLNRNVNLQQAPDPFTDSDVSAVVTNSIMRAQRLGSAVFAVNFAARSQIDLLLFRNKFHGGLDSNGGVSRPDLVTDSSTSIVSIGNLYSSGVAGAGVGWQITGGSGAPIVFPVPAVTTERNRLDIISLRDRIEGWSEGVAATGGARYFPETSGVGSTSNNQLTIQLYGTEFEDNSSSDLTLIAARSSADYPTGNFNTLGLLSLNAHGDDNPGNFYSDGAFFNPVGYNELSPQNRGEGNELAILGSLKTFLRTNDGFDDSAPPSEFFTKGK